MVVTIRGNPCTTLEGVRIPVHEWVGGIARDCKRTKSESGASLPHVWSGDMRYNKNRTCTNERCCI